MVTKFCTPPPGCYTGKMLFANASKIKTNCFITLQPDIFKIISNLPNWAIEHLMLYKRFVYALIYTLIYRYTCAKERKNSYPNFIPDIVNINFP